MCCKRMAALIALALMVSLATSALAYIPTTRDTKMQPARAETPPSDLSAYEFLCETDSAAYYFRDDRDIIAILDKATGWVWKTGADIGFSSDIKDAVKAAETEEEKLAVAEPIEKSMNATYIGVANSLITIEYRDGKTFYLGSAAEKGAQSTLSPDADDPRKFVLDAQFTEIDLNLRVYVTFLECGVHYDIPEREITGAGRKLLTAVWLTPFLGASGGEAEYYDPETGEYGDARKKTAVPGYALVPDGSGSLVRFEDNSVPFVEYIGDVYGQDFATETYFYHWDTDTLDVKDPVAPVFGVAHGDMQAAFVAWATSGAEYMDIVLRPEENMRLKYTFCYPRFEYNVEYHKVYNRKGEGYFTMAETLFPCDAGMTYQFLHGDGSDGTPRADYAGMARSFREHLIEEGVLTPMNAVVGEIPIRLDFILSDMKKGLIGNEQVVVATASDVQEILEDVLAGGVENISGGLIGWQSGAETLAKPGSFSFAGGVGSQKAFADLIRGFAARGVDLSLARNFAAVNELMTRYQNVAIRHINTWFVGHNRSALYDSAPVYEFGYALPSVAAGWLREVSTRAAEFSESLTVSGVTQRLFSSYNHYGATVTLPEAMDVYRTAFAEAEEKLKLNLECPNQYLWAYAERFLQAPIGGSQYIFETDDVPFLQMVLRGTMELYSPYCNFSFYTQEDILRMIDYNVSPSFILSKQPSYFLSDTLSSGLYSTEYEQYKALIRDIYAQVNAALEPVSAYDWTGRTVLANGVIVNEYRQGGARAAVVINYTEEDVTHMGAVIPAQSALCVKEANEP